MISRRRVIAGLAAGGVAISRPAVSQAWLIGKPPASGYVTSAARFNGATDLELAALAATDSPLLLASYWYRLPAAGSWGAPIWVSDPVFNPNDLYDFGNTGPNISLADITNGANFLNFSDPSAEPTNVWHNVLMAADVNHAAGARPHALYFDDADVTDTTSDAGAAFSFLPNTRGFAICGDEFGSFAQVDLADLWWGCSQYIDLSITANRRKFITAGLKPVDLGADGSTPTGTKPTFFLHLAPAALASTFAADKTGNGNNFSIIGTGLTIAPTSPSD